MTTTIYHTNRTTSVTRTPVRKPAPRAVEPFSVTVSAPGELVLSGISPDVLAERLPAIVRLLTR
ncbi:hypothetical protein [Devosia sp. 66-22]|uniref:hypothetical protein n=1 Tax=Devosia sp. 66-22 TaxID=1895753 RepID=UPI000ABFA8BF|nr:hypothetical protein [Devosia sp. 66-22]